MWLDIQVNDSMRVWRMDTTAGLGPPVPVVDLPVSANSGWISINASGNLYISNPDAILLKRSAVSPCDGGSALPRCMRGHDIEISPLTPRWIPQRDVTLVQPSPSVTIPFTFQGTLTGATATITNPKVAVPSPTLAFTGSNPNYQLVRGGDKNKQVRERAGTGTTRASAS